MWTVYMLLKNADFLYHIPLIRHNFFNAIETINGWGFCDNQTLAPCDYNIYRAQTLMTFGIYHFSIFPKCQRYQVGNSKYAMTFAMKFCNIITDAFL